MLVITRRAFESVVIGGSIKVTVLGNKHGGTRLSIEAPREVSIMREELLPLGIAEKREGVKVYLIRSPKGHQYASLEPLPWSENGEKVVGEGVVYVEGEA